MSCPGGLVHQRMKILENSVITHRHSITVRPSSFLEQEVRRLSQACGADTGAGVTMRVCEADGGVSMYDECVWSGHRSWRSTSGRLNQSHVLF